MPACSRTRERAPSAATSSDADTVTIAERHRDAIALMREARHRGGAQLDSLRARLGGERGIERRVLDHVGERLALLHFAREGEEHRPHGVLQLGVGHNHVENRLCIRGDRVPHAERFEHAPRRGRDRGGAQVRLRIRREGRIGDDDPERVAESLAQRERKREAGESAAGDHHIGACDFWLVRHFPRGSGNILLLQ